MIRQGSTVLVQEDNNCTVGTCVFSHDNGNRIGVTLPKRGFIGIYGKPETVKRVKVISV